MFTPSKTVVEALMRCKCTFNADSLLIDWLIVVDLVSFDFDPLEIVGSYKCSQSSRFFFDCTVIEQVTKLHRGSFFAMVGLCCLFFYPEFSLGFVLILFFAHYNLKAQLSFSNRLYMLSLFALSFCEFSSTQ